MQTFLSILKFALPPILGAVIGYVTNYFAIQMLFRPHKKIYFLKIPLPLTPGIIPRQRYQLAESIGQMVSQKLLTEEAVNAQIDSDTFSSTIKTKISEGTSQLLSISLSKIIHPDTNTNTNTNTNTDSGKISFRDIIKQLFMKILSSSGFKGLVSEGVHSLLRKFWDTKALVIYEKLQEQGSIHKLFDLVSSEESLSRVSEIIRRWLKNQMDQNTNLERIIEKDDVNKICSYLAIAYPSIVNVVFQWLEQPQTKEELELRGKSLLRHILEKLNIFQRLLVSAGQYDKQLEENMKGIVEDFLLSTRKGAEDPETKEKMMTWILQFLLDLRSKGLKDVLGKIEGVESGLDRMINQIVFKLGDFLKGDVFLEGLKKSVEHDEETIGEILERKLNISFENSSVKIEELVNEQLSGLHEKPVKLDFLQDYLETKGDVSLSHFIGLDDDLKSQIDEYLTNTLIDMIKTRIPEILQSIDIHTLVVNKINSLDIQNVENLLLMVIQKHLRYINLFGALLGALIGTIQVAYALFLP